MDALAHAADKAQSQRDAAVAKYAEMRQRWQAHEKGMGEAMFQVGDLLDEDLREYGELLGNPPTTFEQLLLAQVLRNQQRILVAVADPADESQAKKPVVG